MSGESDSTALAWPAVAAVCATIAGVDLLQVIVLGKGLGALGGTVLYGIYATGLLYRRSWAAWTTLLMPVVPLAVISGLLGADLRNQLVDAPMVIVAGLQLLAGAGAAGLLFAARFRRTR